MIKELAILLLGAAVLWGCDNTNARVEEYCGVYEGNNNQFGPQSSFYDEVGLY